MKLHPGIGRKGWVNSKTRRRRKTNFRYLNCHFGVLFWLRKSLISFKFKSRNCSNLIIYLHVFKYKRNIDYVYFVQGTFTSLPSGVNLSRSATRPSISSLPVPQAPQSSTSAPQTPVSPTSEVTAKTSFKASSLVPKTTLSSVGSVQKGESLEDENLRLKEQRTCKVCMDGEVGHVTPTKERLLTKYN